MTLLTIEEAVEVLAQRTGRPITSNSFKHILMAGAECRLRIYWRNSGQRFSRLFGFAGAVRGSSAVVREMQVPPFALAQLETRHEIGIAIFEPTDDDWLQLQEVQSLDEDGDVGGFRALADGEARVCRGALLVHAQEVRHLTTKQASMKRGEPGTLSVADGAVEGRRSESAPTAWSIKKPQRFRGYTAPVYTLLVAAHRAGESPPSARQMLEEWKAKPPGEIFEVMTDGIKYYDKYGDPVGQANVKAISETIHRMVRRSPGTL